MTDNKRIDKAIQREQTIQVLNWIASAQAPVMRPHLRPHTWVAIYEDLKEDAKGLGVVFKQWPRHMTHLRFELTHNDGIKVIEVAHFSDLEAGGNTHRILFVPRRWCFDRLLREYRGLSAGDL